MIYGSVCSGIEAASAAWHPLGWHAAWLSEIEAFPSAVLAHHYPDVPNLGDMTKFKGWPHAAIDVLVGGTPCQSFSIAGMRRGLDDPRGNLMLTYLAIAHQYRPRWLVWENVPGVLPSNGGRDFGTFLGGLGQLGYGFAYRVLDAQYFGLAQRRKRVFVVAHLGDWRCAAAVLFEREGLRGDPAPGRSAREDVAGAITASAGRRGGVNEGERSSLIAGTLQASGKAAGSATQEDAESGLLVAFGGNCTSGPIEVATACRAKGGTGHGDFESETFITFDSRQDCVGAGAVAVASQVRRLTPRECERLQGFPDDWTLIPWRGKPASECPDGPRYKAIGNSMAVPVMAWIGRRIALAESIKVPT